VPPTHVENSVKVESNIKFQPISWIIRWKDHTAQSVIALDGEEQPERNSAVLARSGVKYRPGVFNFNARN
jgi:hypothetical protein